MHTLLLHICCGPCATHVINSLRREYDVTGFFFNPNIYPAEEYRRRVQAAKTVCERLDVNIVEGTYEPECFYEAVKGLEEEPENGARCLVCYRLRLAEAARYAMENGYSLLASTLTVGPMKKAALIDPIGVEEAHRAGLSFRASDWKKKDGFRHSCELSREMGIYRQHYCGCEFSIR
ncbi:MAG: epoxyqueuosine reductase QueH [Candidatus Latescibacterota bacterium]